MAASAEILKRYSRLDPAWDERMGRPATDPEARFRPTWLAEVARIAIQIEDRSGESGGIVDQLCGGVEVMARPLVFANQEDIDTFVLLCQSLSRFCPGHGYDSSHDVSQLIDEVSAWIEAGLSPRSVTTWFQMIGGLVGGLDPGLLQQLLSKGIRVIAPLESYAVSGSGKIKADKAKAEMALEEAKTAALEGLMIKGEEEEILRHLVKAKLAGMRDSGKNTFSSNSYVFRNLADFARRCVAELETRGDPRWNPIRRAALKSSILLETARQEYFQQAYPARPYSPSAMIAPLVYFSGDCLAEMNVFTREESLTSELAVSWVRAIRSRRVALSEESVMTLLAGFCDRNLVKRNFIPDSGRPFIGKGLVLAKRLEEADQGENTITPALKKLLPEVVFQLRKRGVVKWLNRSHYEALGLTAFFKSHNSRLAEPVDIQKGGIERIKEGDCALVVFGQFQPETISHLALILAGAEINKESLVRAGILPGGFNGEIWVVVAPNKDNPNKKDWDYSDRVKMIKNSLKGEDGLRILLLDKFFGTTATRLECLRQGMTGVTVVPLRGTDKIGGEAQYTEEMEPDRPDVLNQFPHVFALVATDLSSLPLFWERLSRLTENFECLILLLPFPDIRSSYILVNYPHLSPEALGTLLAHPDNIPLVREYASVNQGKND